MVTLTVLSSGLWMAAMKTEYKGDLSRVAPGLADAPYMLTDAVTDNNPRGRPLAVVSKGQREVGVLLPAVDAHHARRLVILCTHTHRLPILKEKSCRRILRLLKRNGWGCPLSSVLLFSLDWQALLILGISAVVVSVWPLFRVPVRCRS